MATNRPNNSVLYASASQTLGTPGLELSVTTRIYGFIQLSPTSIIPYVEGYSWKDSAVGNTVFLTTFKCWFNNPGPYSDPADYAESKAGGGDSVTLSYQPTLTDVSDITNVTLSINGSRFAAVLGGGAINLTSTVTFTIKDHPGGMFTFVSTPYTYLRLPFCSTSTAGRLYFIKNTSSTQISIAPHIDQPTCPIEDLSGAVTFYRFLSTYPLMNLQANQCLCLMNDGTRWHVLMFYAGLGPGVSRNGTSFRLVNPGNITQDLLYGSLNSTSLRINLPAPTSRRHLIILADRNGTDNANQIQLNAPAGTQIDNLYSTLDVSITSNRRGNCGLYLISNDSAWFIASMFDMSDMDNYSTTDTVVPITPPATRAIAFVTSTALNTNVWVGRSYNVAGITPTTLATGRSVFRVFKQYNTTTAGLGLKTSDSSAPFPETYSNDPEARETQMFLYNLYGSACLRALFCVEFNNAGTQKILFVGQYPSRY
jgi:hypothetical protein